MSQQQLNDPEYYFNKANELLLSGRAEEAEQLHRIAYERFPGDDFVIANYGRILIHNKKYETARNVLTQGSELFAESPSLIIESALGKCLFMMGDFNQAARRLALMLKLCMEQSESEAPVLKFNDLLKVMEEGSNHLTECHIQLGSFEAAEVINSVNRKKLGGRSAFTEYSAARIEEARGNYDKALLLAKVASNLAIGTSDRILEIIDFANKMNGQLGYPDMDFASNEIQGLIDEKKYDEAYVLASSLAQKHSENSEALTIAGYAACKVGKAEEALSYGFRSQKINPYDSLSDNLIGLAYMGMKDHEKAAAFFEKALKRFDAFHPGFIAKGQTVAVAVNLGVCRLAQGKNREALAAFDKGHLDPGNAWPDFYRAIMKLDEGQPKRAKRLLDKAEQLLGNRVGIDYLLVEPTETFESVNSRIAAILSPSGPENTQS